MTNLEAIQLKHALGNVNLPGLKLNYAIVKNLGKLEAEMKVFDKLTTPSDEFKKFEEERVELAKKHAKKDEFGEPVVDENKYVIESLNKFNQELKALQEANKKAIDGRQKQLDDYSKFLDEECGIELHKVPIDSIPENVTTADMKALYFMVSEP